MARVNVYLPDDLAEQARRAGLNVSSLAQEALKRELASQGTSSWLGSLAQLEITGVTHAEAVAALDEARSEVGDDWPVGAE